nr:MAG TPA: hypothetical protein [Caudoviricetes sp.]
MIICAITSFFIFINSFHVNIVKEMFNPTPI